METKTHQLQIRVSSAEKAAIRRLAAAAGMSLSAFVLTRSLPQAHEGVSTRIRELRGGPKLDETLSDLISFLRGLADEEFDAAISAADLTNLTDLQLNCAAAAVEAEAWRREVSAPEWTGEVEPLRQPYFAWSLRSLRPHLLRVTPVAFKRRNLYLPAPGDPRQ